MMRLPLAVAKRSVPDDSPSRAPAAQANPAGAPASISTVAAPSSGDDAGGLDGGADSEHEASAAAAISANAGKNRRGAMFRCELWRTNESPSRMGLRSRVCL